MFPRLCHALLLIPLLCTPVLAQTSPDTTTTTEHHGRRSAAQHFADANLSHDGHLTLDQARSGYKSIAKSFNEIDINHHGYVTIDDIKAWRAAKKAARQAAKRAADDAASGIVRPTRALQRGSSPSATDTSTDMVAPGTGGPPVQGVDLPKAPTDGGRS